jgi:hypothetical protein
MGEVDPIAEDCATLADDNCNGAVNEAAAGCVCFPGTTAACYNGPAGTSGKGICKDGVKTCDPTGKAYLPGCAGEVDPGTESCAHNVDEDCSGTYCTEPLWVDDYGGSASPRSIFSDSAGNIIVAGSFTGSLPLGNTTLISSGQNDAFVSKLDPAGNVLWARQYGGANNQFAMAGAGDSAGNVFIGGYFSGTITFDGITVINAQGTDFFVIKLDGQGVPIWTKVFNEAAAGNGTQILNSLAVDGAGNVVLTGTYDTGLTFDPQHVLAAQGGSELFLAKLKASDGSTLWATTAGDVGSHIGQQVRVDPVGNVVVAGMFQNTMKLGGTTLSVTANNSSFFVARTDSAGTFSWAKSYGPYSGGVTAVVSGLSLDSTGAAVFTGTYQGSLNFGGAVLTNTRAANNLFLAKLDSGGAHKWSLQLGSSLGSGNTTAHRPASVAIDSSNNVYVVGGCGGASLDVGASLTCGSTGNWSPYLIQFDSGGALGFSRVFGSDAGSLWTAASSVSVTPRMAFVAGVNAGGMNFGTGAHASASGSDLVVSSIVTN